MARKNKIIIGRKERLTFPSLCPQPIVGKVDTGAKTCSLHAFYTETFERDGMPWIKFGLHPDQDSNNFEVHCETPLKDRRIVRDSGGHEEERFVIETDVDIAGLSFCVEFTLTSRDNMRYRCLVGRNILNKHFLVDSARSYLHP